MSDATSIGIRSANLVQAELQNLRAIKLLTARHSVFADDNHAAIDAQVLVLSQLLSEDFIRAVCTDSAHVRIEALHARAWLDGADDVDAPSVSWLPLVGSPDSVVDLVCQYRRVFVDIDPDLMARMRAYNRDAHNMDDFGGLSFVINHFLACGLTACEAADAGNEQLF